MIEKSVSVCLRKRDEQVSQKHAVGNNSQTRKASRQNANNLRGVLNRETLSGGREMRGDSVDRQVERKRSVLLAHC